MSGLLGSPWKNALLGLASVNNPQLLQMVLNMQEKRKDRDRQSELDNQNKLLFDLKMADYERKDKARGLLTEALKSNNPMMSFESEGPPELLGQYSRQVEAMGPPQQVEAMGPPRMAPGEFPGTSGPPSLEYPKILGQQPMRQETSPLLGSQPTEQYPRNRMIASALMDMGETGDALKMAGMSQDASDIQLLNTENGYVIYDKSTNKQKLLKDDNGNPIMSATMANHMLAQEREDRIREQKKRDEQYKRENLKLAKDRYDLSVKGLEFKNKQFTKDVQDDLNKRFTDSVKPVNEFSRKVKTALDIVSKPDFNSLDNATLQQALSGIVGSSVRAQAELDKFGNLGSLPERVAGSVSKFVTGEITDGQRQFIQESLLSYLENAAKEVDAYKSKFMDMAIYENSKTPGVDPASVIEQPVPTYRVENGKLIQVK